MVLLDTADQEEKCLLLEDINKMKQTLTNAEANRDPNATSKKRGMDTLTVVSEFGGVKIARIPEKEETARPINRRELLPPPSARRPTPNGPSKTPSNLDNAVLMSDDHDVYAAEETLTFLVPIRKTNDPAAEWKFPTIEILRMMFEDVTKLDLPV